MGVTGWSTSNYLRILSVNLGAMPFLISIWVDRNGNNLGNRFLSVVGTDGTNDHRQGIDFSGASNRGQAVTRDASGATICTLTVDLPDAWTHLAASFVASDDRHIYQNGGDEVPNTNTRAVNDPDCVYIGIRPDQSTPLQADVGIAEMAIFDTTGFTDANRDSLAAALYNGGEGGAGANPINLNNDTGQPWEGSLVVYWPLTDDTDLADAFGSNDLSMVGTITDYGDHPTIDAVASARRPLTPIIMNGLWTPKGIVVGAAAMGVYKFLKRRQRLMSGKGK